MDRIRGAVGGHRPRARSFPPWIFWTMGYALFLWCSLRLIKIWTMSPDLIVMAIVAAGGALLLRTRARRAAWLPALGLGARAIGILVFWLNLLTPKGRALGFLLQRPAQASTVTGYEHGLRGSMVNLPAARGLEAAGVSRGDEVAFIGWSSYSYWARLSGVRLGETAYYALPAASRPR